LENNSPALITDQTMSSTEKIKPLLTNSLLFINPKKEETKDNEKLTYALILNRKYFFGANTLLKEITQSEAVVTPCNSQKCLSNIKANKLVTGLEFTSTFYLREALPSKKEIIIHDE
jgi:hypothetical protein